ncbi:hypothetical protein B0H14DRAFT_2384417, partial [Mycena olivaceomarginata]
MDFETRFAQEGFDLMRPNGGKYPGVSKEVDRSLVDAAADEASSGLFDSASGKIDTLHPEIRQILGFDAQAVLAAEKAAHMESNVDADSNGHTIWINLDEAGTKRAHKKTILRIYMDPTFDI